MPFKNTNTEFGLPENSDFQVGRANRDNNEPFEEGSLLPWSSSPEGSYVYYECAVGAMLDSGIVVHNRLPQINRGIDTISVVDFDDPNMDQATGFGVNLNCQDQYQDIIQRMGHSRYWFRLWGQALRVGYQVPIPGIKTIGGVPAIPYDRNPQWGYNRITPGGNYGGLILWRAQWSLWYTTAVPPKHDRIPASDPSAHITGRASVPSNIQTPYSQADDNAQAQVALRGIPNPGRR